MTPYRDHAGHISKRTDSMLGWLFAMCLLCGLLGGLLGVLGRGMALSIALENCR